MSEEILRNELFSDISPEDQELIKGGQFVGSGGYNNFSSLGGGYGYPNFGGGYGYPNFGGYSYPGRGYFPGIRQFGFFPGAVSGY